MILTLLPQVSQSLPGTAQVPRGDTLLHGLDTLAGAGMQIRDSLAPPPLPGGVAEFVRLIFQVPQSIQIGGAVLAGIVGLAVAVLLWRNRRREVTWFWGATSQLRMILISAAVVVLAVILFGGMKSWNYMQHDNGFCTGCHIMEHPFERFGVGAGKHKDLKCHDCHQQSIYASTRQLVLWVADRPEKIGAHSPVPNARCESCHQVPGGKKPFEHASYLAGHKAHFESDSTALKDLKCATCHGAEVHRFIPSAGACQQSGCHENKEIKLGKMADLPEVKCATCHAFRADLPALADRDSAVRALIPSVTQCRSCHGMDTRPSGYRIELDPHKGSCGSCHDVHLDSLPTDARARCTTCHKSLAASPFHTGANHRRVQAQCLTCHQPHAASVDASDCVGCHTAVKARGLFHPPLPFDTNAVLRKRVGGGGMPVGLSPRHFEEVVPDHQGKGDALPEEPPPREELPTVATPSADSFPHQRHTSLPCLTCHLVSGDRHVVFEAPRGCDLCHHQSLLAGKVVAADCNRCHSPAKRSVPMPMTMSVTGLNRPAVSRSVAFRHELHQKTACATCHQASQTVPPDSVRTCQACHDQHHAKATDCTSCHNRPETPAAHTRTTHVACDACHTAARIASLTPDRTFCGTCHAKQVTHQPGKECTTCHFFATPEAYRPRLLRSGRL